MKDYDRFAKNMAGLGALFDKVPAEPVIELYWRTLSDLSDADFERACTLAAKRLKFFPKPAELREMVAEDQEAIAMAAWEELLGAIRDVSQYRSVDFLDPAISATVEFMGGWEAVCLWTREELAFRRKEFMDTYRISRRRNPERKVLGGQFGGKPVEIGYGRRDLKLVAKR